MFKRACSRQLEAQLNTLQKDGPAAWAALPEEEPVSYTHLTLPTILRV